MHLALGIMDRLYEAFYPRGAAPALGILYTSILLLPGIPFRSGSQHVDISLFQATAVSTPSSWGHLALLLSTEPGPGFQQHLLVFVELYVN